MTNADKIRTMTDEELAKFLQHIERYQTYGYYSCYGLDWLKKEVKESD